MSPSEMDTVFKFYKQYETELLAELAKQPLPIAQVYFHRIYDDKYCGRITIILEGIGNVAYAYVSNTGEVHHHRLAKRLYPQHDPVYTQVEKWGAYVRDCFHAAERIKEFWEKAKEELAAEVWRPDRVAKLLDAGVELETL